MPKLPVLSAQEIIKVLEKKDSYWIGLKGVIIFTIIQK